MSKLKDCPKCGDNKWRKKGIDKSGRQRYICKSCLHRTVTLELKEVDEKSQTTQNDYESKIMSAFDKSGKVMDIDRYCLFYNLPRQDVKNYKLVTHTGTPFYNVVFYENAEEINFLTEEFLKSIINKHTKKYRSKNLVPVKRTSNIVRGIYTDMHIGMHPDKKSIALYGGTWTESDQYDRMIIFAHDVISESKNRSASKCIIDELGDFVDGWDGQTVRKGHNLPQNMTNEEMFDQAVSLKVNLCDVLWSQNIFSELIFNNICNDNHAGSFGYVVNSAVKSILEAKYNNVSVINHRKFINHYTVGKHTKVISHGKDMEDSKFGFKPKLDQPGEKKITNYILANGLSGMIEFSKGDSHQCLYDYATSDIFDYLNHCSFAPPSQWVQTNFQRGRSGYSIQTFDENTDELPITFPRIFKR